MDSPWHENLDAKWRPAEQLDLHALQHTSAEWGYTRRYSRTLRVVKQVC